jgi:predicted Zn-dependent protease
MHQRSPRSSLEIRADRNGKDVNAFSMPGGYVLITRGMFDQMRNESELAGVLAHENIARRADSDHLQRPAGQPARFRR